MDARKPAEPLRPGKRVALQRTQLQRMFPRADGFFLAALSRIDFSKPNERLLVVRSTCRP